MGQVSSPSASTRRVDVENGLACDIWIPDRKVMPSGSSEVPNKSESGEMGWSSKTKVGLGVLFDIQGGVC